MVYCVSNHFILQPFERLMFPCRPELEVECWAHNAYHVPGAPDVPPSAIPFAAIQCQIQRGEIFLTNPPMWITTTLQRVSSLMVCGALSSFMHSILAHDRLCLYITLGVMLPFFLLNRASLSYLTVLLDRLHITFCTLHTICTITVSPHHQ